LGHLEFDVAHVTFDFGEVLDGVFDEGHGAFDLAEVVLDGANIDINRSYGWSYQRN
jgi:hypothetical protein